MTMTEMKILQAVKIKELNEALIAEGYLSLREKAAVLGLSNSTTWVILRANYKQAGISARTIKRILEQPNLPSRIRRIVEAYVQNKMAGTYGHNKPSLRRFNKAIRGEQLKLAI